MYAFDGLIDDIADGKKLFEEVKVNYKYHEISAKELTEATF